MIHAVAFGGNNQSGPIEVATARNACASASGRMDFETETFLVQPAHSLRGEGFDASEDGTGRGTPLVPAAFPCKDYGADVGEVAPALQVRRLTPTECARLQGFPDDYLDIPYRNKPAADGPKYKALGNSWAVPCVTWIGQRISASIE